jgi:hypothetical protein
VPALTVVFANLREFRKELESIFAGESSLCTFSVSIGIEYAAKTIASLGDGPGFEAQRDVLRRGSTSAPNPIGFAVYCYLADFDQTPLPDTFCKVSVFNLDVLHNLRAATALDGPREVDAPLHAFVAAQNMDLTELRRVKLAAQANMTPADSAQLELTELRVELADIDEQYRSEGCAECGASQHLQAR